MTMWAQGGQFEARGTRDGWEAVRTAGDCSGEPAAGLAGRPAGKAEIGGRCA